MEDVIPKIEQWITDNNEYERLQFRFGGQQAESDANADFFLFAFIVGITICVVLLK